MKKQSAIVQSAGVAISWNNSILLVHPTNASWTRAMSIPKGIVDAGEDVLSAAIRELKEETGITIKPADIADPSHTITINYDKNGKVYKQLTVFFLFADGATKERLQIPDKIPKQNLQLHEIDWAGFIPFSEVQTKMLPRLLPIVETILSNQSKLTAE